MQWRPTMTSSDAEQYVAGTALPGLWYHGTRGSNRGLKMLDVGFNPEPDHIGLQKYGNGLYLTSVYEDAKKWGPMVFEARIQVTRGRLGHCEKYPGLVIYDDIAEDLGIVVRYRELKKTAFEPQAFAQAIQEKGLDAYTVGHDWVVVVNPRCLVFTDVR